MNNGENILSNIEYHEDNKWCLSIPSFHVNTSWNFNYKYWKLHTKVIHGIKT